LLRKILEITSSEFIFGGFELNKTSCSFLYEGAKTFGENRDIAGAIK
jgi:hypothetical protein